MEPCQWHHSTLSHDATLADTMITATADTYDVVLFLQLQLPLAATAMIVSHDEATSLGY